jgi:hypothetical protein
LLDAAHAAVRAWSDAKWRVFFALFAMLAVIAVMQAAEWFARKWGWNEAMIRWVGIESYLIIGLILLWFLLSAVLWMDVILLRFG